MEARATPMELGIVEGQHKKARRSYTSEDKEDT